MRLSALETGEIGNEIGDEIGNKIGRAWVSNTMRSPYRMTNPVRRDCSTRGHEISALLLSPSSRHVIFPAAVKFALPSLFDNPEPRSVRRALLTREIEDARKRDWIKTCCGVLMREIGQLSLHSVSRNRAALARFDETRSCDCGKTRNKF